MDRAEFEVAIEVAGVISTITMGLLRDPPASLAAVARREDFDRETIQAWTDHAEDPARRSKIVADAVNRIDPLLCVEAPTRRGKHPERDAKRNIAAWRRCGSSLSGSA